MDQFKEGAHTKEALLSFRFRARAPVAWPAPAPGAGTGDEQVKTEDAVTYTLVNSLILLLDKAPKNRPP